MKSMDAEAGNSKMITKARPILTLRRLRRCHCPDCLNYCRPSQLQIGDSINQLLIFVGSKIPSNGI